MRAFRQVLGPLLVRHRWRLIVAISGAVAAQALGITLPLLARWAIHRTITLQSAGALVDEARQSQLFVTIGLLFLAVVVVRSAARWVQLVYGERLGHQVLAGLRRKMCRHLVRLSHGYFERRAEGKVMIRFIGDANALRTWLARTVVSFPADVVAVLLIALVVFVLQPLLALALLVPLALMIPLVMLVNPIARRWTRAGRKCQTRLCGHLGELLHSLRYVKALGLEDSSTAAADAQIDGVAEAGIKRAVPDAFLQASALGLTTLALGAVVVIGTRQMTAGMIQDGDLLAVVWLILQIRGPVDRLSRANLMHQRAVVAVDRIAALLNRPIEMGWSEGLSEYAGPGRVLEFQDVSYKDARGNWAVHGLTARFEGPSAVLVNDGGNGSGRMLLDLILRIRRPHRGHICLDDTDVRKLRVRDIRSAIGLVSSPWVIADRDGTWRLLETLYHARREELTAAWKAAGQLDHDAPGLELDTVVEAVKKGGISTTLSNPEVKLRIAFAVGLLGEPSILLVDDPFTGCPRHVLPRVNHSLYQLSTKRLIIVSACDPSLSGLFANHVELTGGTVRRKRISADSSQDTNGRLGAVSVENKSCPEATTILGDIDRAML